MLFFTSAPCAVVPQARRSSTVSDFCIVHFLAEVGTDVVLFIFALPSLVHSGLAVVPQGGAVVPRQRQYRSQPWRLWPGLAPAVAAVVPRSLTVVPHGLAVVLLVRGGSTAWPYGSTVGQGR